MESLSPPPPAVPAATPSPGFSIGGYGASSVAAKIMAKYGFKVIVYLLKGMKTKEIYLQQDLQITKYQWQL